jgi:hypothetical protein
MPTFKEERAMSSQSSWFSGTAVLSAALLVLMPARAVAQSASSDKPQITTTAVRLLDTTEPAAAKPGTPTPATGRPKVKMIDDLVPAAAEKAAATEIVDEPPSEKQKPGSDPLVESSPGKPKNPTADKQEHLQPIPDPKSLGQAEIEAASFQGVIPGVSTLRDVEKAWGAPKEVNKQDKLITHKHSVDAFPRVEVTYLNDKVTSIIIRF